MIVLSVCLNDFKPKKMIQNNMHLVTFELVYISYCKYSSV